MACDFYGWFVGDTREGAIDDGFGKPTEAVND
jgi:hypothetical protein